MLREDDRLSVLIPVHNEEGAVGDTLLKCRETLESLGIPWEILVIDDGSTDGTPGILARHGFARRITNPYNLGYGASLKKGLRESTGNWVLILDADGTYPLDRIGDLLAPAGDYDMVVGCRRHKRDHTGRRPAKWFLRKLAGLLTGRKIPDLNSGMRLFRKDLAMEFFHLYPPGYSFTSTLTVAFFTHDYTVKYVDIPYHKRIGRSGIRPAHFVDFVALMVKLVVCFRPLRMLTPVALLFGAAGVAKGTRDYLAGGHIGTLASLLVLFGFQLWFLALIAEITANRNRH